MPLKTNYSSFFLCALKVAKKEVSPSPSDSYFFFRPVVLSFSYSGLWSHLARAMRCEDELLQLSNGFVVATATYIQNQWHSRGFLEVPIKYIIFLSKSNHRNSYFKRLIFPFLERYPQKNSIQTKAGKKTNSRKPRIPFGNANSQDYAPDSRLTDSRTQDIFLPWCIFVGLPLECSVLLCPLCVLCVRNVKQISH